MVDPILFALALSEREKLGGPGSGRHPEGGKKKYTPGDTHHDVLTKFGYKQSEESSLYRHPGGAAAQTSGKSWTHFGTRGPGGIVRPTGAEGKSAESLFNHLQDYHL